MLFGVSKQPVLQQATVCLGGQVKSQAGYITVVTIKAEQNPGFSSQFTGKQGGGDQLEPQNQSSTKVLYVFSVHILVSQCSHCACYSNSIEQMPSFYRAMK